MPAGPRSGDSASLSRRACVRTILPAPGLWVLLLCRSVMNSSSRSGLSVDLPARIPVFLYSSIVVRFFA